jgi:hypothetical protein
MELTDSRRMGGDMDMLRAAAQVVDGWRWVNERLVGGLPVRPSIGIWHPHGNI